MRGPGGGGSCAFGAAPRRSSGSAPRVRGRSRRGDRARPAPARGRGRHRRRRAPQPFDPARSTSNSSTAPRSARPSSASPSRCRSAAAGACSRTRRAPGASRRSPTRTRPCSRARSRFREAFAAAVLDEARLAALNEQQGALDKLAATLQGLTRGGENAGYDLLRQQSRARLHRTAVASAKARADASRALLEAWTGEAVVLPAVRLSDLAGGASTPPAASTAPAATTPAGQEHPRVASLEAGARAGALEAGGRAAPVDPGSASVRGVPRHHRRDRHDEPRDLAPAHGAVDAVRSRAGRGRAGGRRSRRGEGGSGEPQVRERRARQGFGAQAGDAGGEHRRRGSDRHGRGRRPRGEGRPALPGGRGCRSPRCSTPTAPPKKRGWRGSIWRTRSRWRAWPGCARRASLRDAALDKACGAGVARRRGRRG